jgi:hypothetical protein
VGEPVNEHWLIPKKNGPLKIYFFRVLLKDIYFLFMRDPAGPVSPFFGYDDVLI